MKNRFASYVRFFCIFLGITSVSAYAGPTRVIHTLESLEYRHINGGTDFETWNQTPPTHFEFDFNHVELGLPRECTRFLSFEYNPDFYGASFSRCIKIYLTPDVNENPRPAQKTVYLFLDSTDLEWMPEGSLIQEINLLGKEIIHSKKCKCPSLMPMAVEKVQKLYFNTVLTAIKNALERSSKPFRLKATQISPDRSELVSLAVSELGLSRNPEILAEFNLNLPTIAIDKIRKKLFKLEQVFQKHILNAVEKNHSRWWHSPFKLGGTSTSIKSKIQNENTIRCNERFDDLSKLIQEEANDAKKRLRSQEKKTLL